MTIYDLELAVALGEVEVAPEMEWRYRLGRMREHARRMYDQRMRAIVGDEELVRRLGLGFYPGAGW